MFPQLTAPFDFVMGAARTAPEPLVLLALGLALLTLSFRATRSHV